MCFKSSCFYYSTVTNPTFLPGRMFRLHKTLEGKELTHFSYHVYCHLLCGPLLAAQLHPFSLGNMPSASHTFITHFTHIFVLNSLLLVLVPTSCGALFFRSSAYLRQSPLNYSCCSVQSFKYSVLPCTY